MARQRRMVVATLALLVAFPLLQPAVSLGQEAAAAVRLETVGDVATLYRWSTDRCEDEFIPDAPARAFRRDDGQVVLIATHRENWSLVGPSVEQARPQCAAMLRSSRSSLPTGGMLWIEATYTFDGRNVAALISQDLSRETRAAGCVPDGQPGQCWVNLIVGATSSDGGRSFSVTEPVASLGLAYPSGTQGRFGAFTTSNIVRNDSAFFSMIFTQGTGVQPPGNCLFRTEDPRREGGWRAWDGTSFSIDMSHPGQGACQPVGRGSLLTEVRSLSYDSRRGIWIAVFLGRLRLQGDDAPVPGFYYSISSNLTDWQPARRLMAAPTRARVDDHNVTFSYPSLLDPNSASRNFDTVEHDEVIVLFTAHHLHNGNGTMNRDLQFVRVRVSAD